MANATAQLFDGLNLDMRPVSTCFDAANCHMSDSKHVPYLRLRILPIHQHGFNFLNVLFSKYVSFNFFASLISAFSCSVSVIIRACSQKQMIRSNARGIVASMKHAQSFWDWTIMKFPGKSVSGNVPSVNRELPIAKPARFPARPNPATFCFLNVLPESNFRGPHPANGSSTCPAAISSPVRLSKPPVVNEVILPTSFAFSFDHKQETRQPNRVKQAHDGLTTEPAGKLSFMLRAVSTLATG